MLRPRPLLLLLLLLVAAASAAAVGGTRDRQLVPAPPIINARSPNAHIWSCDSPGSEQLHNLIGNSHQQGLEIISVGESSIHVYTETHDDGSLRSIGLKGCARLAALLNLFHQELIQNWHKLEDQTDRDWIQQSSVEQIEGQAHQHIVRRSTKDEWFTEYHDVSEIYSWFQDLATAHPDYVTLNSSIGKTHSNTDIMAVHVTEKAEQRDKIKVYFQCLLHAREWISGPVCMYIARQLAVSSDSAIQELLRRIEFIIVPIANPDGYHLTWLEYPKYRFWRKNTAPTSNPACDGTDLNRNFDAHWSLVGSSNDPCSDMYHGPEAESELEVKAISSYIRANAPIQAAIDFHSYSQAILYPPAWTAENTENTAIMENMASWMSYAANKVGREYGSQSMHSLYLAAGTFPDWMLVQEAGKRKDNSLCLPVVFTAELRPKDTPESTFTAFMVNTEEILPTCQEMMAAVEKFSHLIIDEYVLCTERRDHNNVM